MNARNRQAPCPRCGEEFPVEKSIWFYANRLYCSEYCCRAAAGQLRPHSQ